MASNQKNIIIKGAKMNNLKNIDVSIPRNELTVITGVSGSGKSSLAFDTLFAEGQRRYVESLSSYARQFLGKLEKPLVDSIEGIAPGIAIEQKVTSRSSRSTVGTQTEIYDYLKLLFARAGKTISPISGKEVRKDSVDDVVSFCESLNDKTKGVILSPIKYPSGRTLEEHVNILKQQGFSRFFYRSEFLKIVDLEKDIKTNSIDKSQLMLVVDRFSRNVVDEDNLSRIADSVQTAFFEGQGECVIYLPESNKQNHFSNKFELDGITFEEPSVHFFTFNNPVGACKKCQGFGHVLGIDEDLVFPNKRLSVYDDAIQPWKGEKMQEWKEDLIYSASKFDFPIHKPIEELTDKQYELLWSGNKYFVGLDRYFEYLQEKSYKIQYRVLLSRYRGRTLCPDCNGTRLRKDASYVKVGGYSIQELVLMPLKNLSQVVRGLKLDENSVKISDRILYEVNSRIQFLLEVGLDYLTLNRLSSTLSGGESQRINLATSLGSSLVGSMYILDEPSIGLHSRDTERLINVLKALKKKGNSVIVVEHDEDIMRASDNLIDIGPLAGAKGGEVVFSGPTKELNNADTLTAKYLNSRMQIPVPNNRRAWNQSVKLLSCSENNLKNIDVEIPLNTLTVITGVSGSGKSTLVKNILYPAVKKYKGETIAEKTGKFSSLEGDLDAFDHIEFVDQNPIGKSSRSNPATYIKAYDDIRSIFTKTNLAKARALQPKHFSFNVAGGRCDNCDGEGQIKVEMQFMADVYLKCEVCNGDRFKDEILEVKYRGKNIAEVLNLTVDEAIEFFNSEKLTAAEKKVVNKLQALQKTGLGYIPLGQPSNTISGGEAQRIKLAYYLSKGVTNPKTLFIFDEPSTGLHFNDIKKLLIAFDELIKLGHSVLVIEHHLDIVKCADWILDLGPEGGNEGGRLIFSGTPEELIHKKGSYTSEYLKAYLT